MSTYVILLYYISTVYSRVYPMTSVIPYIYIYIYIGEYPLYEYRLYDNLWYSPLSRNCIFPLNSINYFQVN